MTLSKTNRRRTNRQNRRRAFLFVDMLLGIAVLALIFGSTAVMLAGLARQRKIAAQHFLANETVANILEEIATSKSPDFDQEAAKRIVLPTDVPLQLPGAKLSIDVKEVANDELATQQITCAVSWPSALGQPPYRCVLTTWRFQHE